MYVRASSKIRRLQDKDHAAYVSETEPAKFVMKYQKQVQTTNNNGMAGIEKAVRHTSLVATNYELK